MELTREEIEADLAATIRDEERLSTIVDNLEKFISDSHGENRNSYRTHLFVFRTLYDQATALKHRIQNRLS